MKKSYKYFFAICLCPFLLTACTPPPSYNIKAYSSDLSLGAVKGIASEGEEKEEGSKLALEAVENLPESNPFIGWAKNGRTIVSLDKKMELTYGSDTAGSYVAIFEEGKNNPKAMCYAALSKVDCQPENYSNFSFNISISNVSSGATTYNTFIEGNINNGEYLTDNKTICYLGGSEGVIIYKFQITFNFETSDKTEKVVYVFNSTFYDDLFGNNWEYVLTEHFDDLNTDISLTFNKLTYSLLHQQ